MKKINQLIKDIIPVILGVLIALIINNWNEDRKDKKYLNQIFSSINEELEESKTGIENTIPRQKLLLDSLEVYLDDETVSLFEIMRKAGGIRFTTIKNNSWKAISNSKIELVEYEKISILSDIDEAKDILELQSEKLFDFLINNSEATSKGKKELFRMIVGNIMAIEKRLQSNIQELNEK